MFKQDYLLKQIAQMTKVVLKIFFGLDVDKNEDDFDFQDADSAALYYELKSMVNIGNISGAEDRLFEVLNEKPTNENLKTALLFYDYLNKKDDSFLEANNFSRKEIEMGVDDCFKLYNVQDEVEKIVPRINTY